MADKDVPSLMNKLIDGIILLIVAIFTISMLLSMIRPYIGLAIVSVVLVLTGGFVVKRFRRW